jgi:hypothetical protein
MCSGGAEPASSAATLRRHRHLPPRRQRVDRRTLGRPPAAAKDTSPHPVVRWPPRGRVREGRVQLLVVAPAGPSWSRAP